ncbi:metallophosphoesterase family protein [Alteribacillus sp. HJP-4]|uniref:metallophosphoesterase family protein n=1 Tax=Alteribacillus sp. HJP-4 TaxID=2775394 RepID=UPI0035CD30C4
MKCLILSDSHGSQQELQEVIDRHIDEMDAVFHCGDSELRASSPVWKGAFVVEGNCDIPGEFQEYLTKEVKGINVMVTHGHLYNVKMTNVPLSYKAEEEEAAIACFGHSHIAEAFQENKVIFINPGSLLLPRGRREQTYAVVSVVDKLCTVSFLERISGEEISDMRQSFSME